MTDTIIIFIKKKCENQLITGHIRCDSVSASDLGLSLSNVFFV